MILMEITGERALIVTFWLNKQRKKQNSRRK